MSEDLIPRDQRRQIAAGMRDVMAATLSHNTLLFERRMGYAPVNVLIGGAVSGLCAYAWAAKADDVPDAELEEAIVAAVREAFQTLRTAAQMPPSEGSA